MQRVILFLLNVVSLTSSASQRPMVIPDEPLCPEYELVQTTQSMTESSVTPQDSTPRCDETAEYFGYGANHRWLRLEGPGGNVIIRHKPERDGICGTTHPGWIQGKIPGPYGYTVAKMCYYSNPPPGYTCQDNFECTEFLKIDIFNCNDNYFLYRFEPSSSRHPSSCTRAFCTSFARPCELPTYHVPTLPEMSLNYRTTSPTGDNARRDFAKANYVNGKTWIRLQGTGGTEIIKEKPPRDTGACNTQNPGWIMGTPPAQVETEIERQLCYSMGSDETCGDGRRIDIMKCRHFMIYRLHASSSQSISAFCTHQPSYNLCQPNSYINIKVSGEWSTRSYRLTTRQNDDQYADGKTWMKLEGYDGLLKVITTSNVGPLVTKFNEPALETGLCGVSNPGWMEGEIPTAPEGIVRRRLCYYDGTETTCPNPREIDVVSCGLFILYRFQKVPTTSKSIQDAFCTEVDSPEPCFFRPCLHNSECVGRKSCYKCNCPEGVSGKNCEIAGPNDCDSQPCLNGATCYDKVGAYTCHCSPGFTGDNCGTEINECDAGPCQNGATCVKTTDGHECRCSAGYTGDNCENEDTDTDECSPNPCKHYGVCTDEVNAFTCECILGWSGQKCEDSTKIDQTITSIEEKYNSSGGGGGFWAWLFGLAAVAFAGIARMIGGIAIAGLGAIGSISGIPASIAAAFTFAGGTIATATITTVAVGTATASGTTAAATGSIAAALAPGVAALGTLGTVATIAGVLKDSINDYNIEQQHKDPSNNRCPRMNLGSGLEGLRSGNEKCAKKYKDKACSVREKAKPKNDNGNSDKKPTEAPVQTGAPGDSTTTEKPSSCSATCPVVQNPEHGTLTGDKTNCGDSASFSCNDGYQLAGCDEQQCKITCQSNGQWSSEVPKCVRSTCGGLVTVSASHPQEIIQSSPEQTDCNWAVVSETSSSMLVQFVDLQLTNGDNECEEYVEVVIGTTRQRYCGLKPDETITIENAGMIRSHFRSPSSRSSFNVKLSLQTGCGSSKGFFRRAVACKRCRIDANKLSEWPKYAPVLLDGSGELIQPNGDGTLTFNDMATATAHCFESKFIRYDIEKVQLTCHNGMFDVNVASGRDNGIHHGERFIDLGCKKLPKPEFRNIGVKLHEKWDIYTQMSITYNNSEKRPYYVEHEVLGKSIKWNEKSHRPDFTKAKVPGYSEVPVDSYSKSKQHDQLEGINGGLATKYIDCCAANYFVRGHLAPNADFSLRCMRDATFYMVNAAAQWQGINAGNWLVLESAIRDYASAKALTIKVYSGVHGTLELENGGRNHKINFPAGTPVPSHFWKIVYDEARNAAVAFVILNNPYATTDPVSGFPTGADKLCKAQCNYLPSPATQTATKGILMCCPYDDLKPPCLKMTLPNIIPAPSNLFESTIREDVDFGNALKSKVK